MTGDPLPRARAHCEQDVVLVNVLERSPSLCAGRTALRYVGQPLRPTHSILSNLLQSEQSARPAASLILNLQVRRICNPRGAHTAG